MKISLTAEQKKIIFLSSMGGLLEYYDFYIYIVFSGYFAHQFFPSNDILISLIATYAVFFIAYLTRIVGAIFFSYMGDKHGRKIVMILTMIIMGLASLGIGLIPSYAQIGIMAPILLLLLRSLQGFAIGGELPSMMVYVAESISHHIGFAMGKVWSVTISGLLIGMLINFGLLHFLSDGQMYTFGWRIPFIVGGFLCFIAYQFRKRLNETMAFKEIQQRNRFPLKEVLQHHFPQVLISGGLVILMAVPTTLFIFFMPAYLTKIIGIVNSQVGYLSVLGIGVAVLFIYIGGILAELFSVNKILIIVIIMLMLTTPLAYYMIVHNYYLWIAILMLNMFQGMLISLPTMIIPKLFPTHIRLNGVAVSYNISALIFVGLTPVIVTSLIKLTAAIFLVPVIFVCITLLLGLIAVICTQKQQLYI